MDKHLKVFKEMINSEIEVSHKMMLEKNVDGLIYTIEHKDHFVTDPENDKEVEYSDSVYDLIQERIDEDEESNRAVKDTEDYLNTHR